MQFTKPSFYYASLRPYVNRILRKLGRFCKDAVPDVRLVPPT